MISSPLAWACAAVGVLLLPGPSTERARVAALAGRVRTTSAVSPAPASRPAAPPAVMAAGAVVAVGAVGAIGGLVLGLTAATALATGSYVAVRAARGRAGARRTQALLTAVRLLVAELSAGGAPAAAFGAAAAAAPEYRLPLEAAAEACARGEPPVLEGADLAGLGHAWQLAALTGAPIGAAVGRVADDLAARLDHRRTVAVAVSGAQASALMLAALPVLGVVLGIAMGAHPVEVLFTTPTGRVLCLLGVLLDCAGVVWTARLTARAARP